MPFDTALLAIALLEVAKKLAEKGIIDPALEAGLEPFKQKLTGFYRAKKSEQELHAAFLVALKSIAAPVEQADELTLWLRAQGLDRLQAANNAALRQEVALALVGFTDPQAAPPENLVTALGWPRSRVSELSQVLLHLRAGLAKTSWQPLLDYADQAHQRNILQALLAQVTRLDLALVETPEGQALRVVWIKQGLSEQEAAQIEKKYRRSIRLDFENLETRGLSPQLLTSKPDANLALRSLPLESVYLEPGLIPLRSEREREAEQEEMLQADDTRRLITELRQQQKRVSDALAGTEKLVILGKPGSGKTVSLKFIALMLARGQVGAARLRLEFPYLPVYVRLAQYAERLKDDSGLAFEIFLMESVGPYYCPGTPNIGEFLQIALDKGLCLLLLDGLDEVGDVGDTLIKGKTLRSAVLTEVQRFSRQRCQPDCQNRIIVTSRLEGYRRGDLQDFDEMELSTLAMPDEVREFLLRWFAAHEQKNHPGLASQDYYRAAQASVEPLMSDILRSASIQRLAINPLLLTILAMIHKLGTRLPNERVRLYQIVTQTMIESWRQAQNIRSLSIYQVLPVSRIAPMLASLAYWVHENEPGGVMPEKDWQTRIKHLLVEKDDELKDEKAAELAEMFMRHAREEVGLLIERSPGQIGFFHLTLEEYLAGVEIATRKESERRAMIKKHWANPRWREVLLLAAGQLMINGSQELDGFVLDLRMRDEDGNAGQQGLPALLAGKAIVDVGSEYFIRKVVRETRDELIKLATSTPTQPSTRAECADLADELGYLPGDLHSFIPISGTQSPAFQIAKYPVTNLQYARFLAAEDFHLEIFWNDFPQYAHAQKKYARLGSGGDAGYTWLKKNWDERNKVTPRYWNDPRFGKSRACAPVVGVSWYEANAYCKWLGWHWDELEEGRQGLSKPALVRLPTEQEWVLAAGGEDGQRYAWGKLRVEKEIVDYANTVESAINRTTPVWMYPRGESQPYHLMDMSGNVWEWQANFWDQDHETLPLRGGAFNYNQDYARCACRLWYNPDDGFRSRGFRVSLSPNLLS